MKRLLCSLLVLCFSCSGANADSNSTQAAPRTNGGALKMLFKIEQGADFFTISPDRKLLCAIYWERKGEQVADGARFKVWRLDTSTNEPSWQWKCGSYRPLQIAIAPDGKTLAAACSDGNLRLWNVQSSKFLRTVAFKEFTEMDAVTYSADGKTLVIGGSYIPDWERDLAKDWRKPIPHPHSWIFFLNAETLQPHPRFKPFLFDGRVHSIGLSPDNQHLALSGTFEIEDFTVSGAGFGMHGTVGIYDTRGGKNFTRLTKLYDAGSTHPFYVEDYDDEDTTFCFAHDSRTFLVGSNAGESDRAFHGVWRFQNGDAVQQMPISMENTADAVGCRYPPLTLSPDGKFVAKGYGSDIQIFDTENGTVKKSLGTLGAVIFVAFSPNSESLISVDSHGTVLRWPLKDMTQ